MAVSNIVKTLQNIMRSDAGINGDAQRIEQMVWLIFLKVYDYKEEIWEMDDENYKSIIPEPLRWRNWAPHLDEEGKERNDCLTGDQLLAFIDNKLFPVLKGNDSADGTIKGIHVTRQTPRGKAIVQEVFSEVNQYMKNGILLRQMVNVIDGIDLLDDTECHAFGDIYESILKDLQGAGNAGEFYTPRALTDVIIKLLDPKLGEKVGDFAAGTGGFLVSALNHLAPQRNVASDDELFQGSVVGQEWKPFPYLLGVTNLLLHDMDNPEFYHTDSLGKSMCDYQRKDKVDVIAMNPPYGGATDASTKQNFKSEFRSSESADLFIVLIMYRLAEHGRAGVIIPDGFLFGNDGAKYAIKKRLLTEFNLHTIVRLPGDIFAPYTSIATNVLFFDNECAEGAPEGFKTAQIWFYRLDMPEGYKHFSKTRPMRPEHCQPLLDWWYDRKEIIDSEKKDEKSRCFTPDQLLELMCNFDQCGFPKEETVVVDPDELLRAYHSERAMLDATIDNTLQKIQQLLGIKI